MARQRGEERRGRSRNRRGRNRGQRSENSTEINANDSGSTNAPTPFAGPPAGMAGASASMPIQNITQSFSTPTQHRADKKGGRPPRAPREPRAPRQNTSGNGATQDVVSNESPAPVAAAPKAIEVIAKPMPELPKVAFVALEETPLHQVVQSAGMTWVATDSSKHAQAQSQIQTEPEVTQLGRAPKAPVSLPDGPMLLVETGGQGKTV